jgi:hypothetical protein
MGCARGARTSPHYYGRRLAVKRRGLVLCGAQIDLRPLPPEHRDEADRGDEDAPYEGRAAPAWRDQWKGDRGDRSCEAHARRERDEDLPQSRTHATQPSAGSTSSR